MDLFWLILDYPRSAIAGLSLVLKFILSEILSFLYFAVLAWNCLFTPILGEFWGILPQMWSPIVLTPNTSFEP